GRTTRKDHRGRLPGRDLGDRRIGRHDLGVDVRLPHPAGDQLRVLRPEIDYQHGVRVGGLVGHGWLPLTDRSRLSPGSGPAESIEARPAVRGRGDPAWVAAGPRRRADAAVPGN